MPSLYNPDSFNYTPMNWNEIFIQDSPSGNPWWKNLLLGTGQYFLNGLTNTVNAANYGNPYSTQQTTNQLLFPLLLVGAVVLILKK